MAQVRVFVESTDPEGEVAVSQTIQEEVDEDGNITQWGGTAFYGTVKNGDVLEYDDDLPPLVGPEFLPVATKAPTTPVTAPPAPPAPADSAGGVS